MRIPWDRANERFLILIDQFDRVHGRHQRRLPSRLRESFPPERCRRLCLEKHQVSLHAGRLQVPQ